MANAASQQYDHVAPAVNWNVLLALYPARLRTRPPGRYALILISSGRCQDVWRLLLGAIQRAEGWLCPAVSEQSRFFGGRIRSSPLDAHLELYRALRQNALELGDEVNFRRTDLALSSTREPANRSITCRLVEVML